MEKKSDSEHEKQIFNHVNAELDPFEINFLPQFKKNRGPRQPFVNQYGVIIGDHEYQSDHSPLNTWNTDTDPSIMAGDEWVHPFKDIGFHSSENKDYFEQGIAPQSGIFMHPDKDVAYPLYNKETDDAVPKVQELSDDFDDVVDSGGSN